MSESMEKDALRWRHLMELCGSVDHYDWSTIRFVQDQRTMTRMIVVEGKGGAAGKVIEGASFDQCMDIARFQRIRDATT